MARFYEINPIDVTRLLSKGDLNIGFLLHVAEKFHVDLKWLITGQPNDLPEELPTLKKPTDKR